jgi:hypothetical protein
MSTSAGPNSQGESNLILAFDVADNANSYKGKPTTNLLKFIIGVYGENTGTYFKTHYYTSTQTVPRLGKVTVNSINVYNDYNGGSGVCCEQLFRFGETVYVSGNTLYTYSIIYRSATGYTGPNMMYRYEYGASGYVTEGGVFNAGQQTSLGDGWYHAWGQFTTQASTTYLNTYFFIYEYATYNTIDIAAAMIVQGNYILPPEQFIPFTTTRSNTQGLLDLTGKNTISLANTTFNSNAQIYYDGVSAYTGVTNSNSINPLTNSFTIIVIANSDPSIGGDGWDLWVAKRNGGSNGYYIGANNPSGVRFMLGNDAGARTDTSFLSYTANTWTMYTGILDRSANTQTLIKNNFQETASTTPAGGNYYNTTNLSIGGDIGINAYYVNGQVAITLMYNRALTSTEITQNYNQYKTRFNLS